MSWLVDRSRIQAYQDCKRLRWWNFHHGKTGLERKAFGLPLLNGSALHDGFAQLLSGHPIDAIVADVATNYRAAIATRGVAHEDPASAEHLVAEQLTLLEGLLRAWAQVRLPALRAEYDVVAIEQEMPWLMGADIVDMVRCDALLRRKVDGILFIQEFKSLTSVSEGWIEQWEHNSQLLANTRAIETMMKEPIGGVLIEGILKGRRATDKAVMSPFRGSITQQSALCYGYKHETKERAIVYDTSWAKNATKVASWEEMPIDEWIAKVMTEADLISMFIPLPPIRPVGRELNRWQRQTLAQESRIRADVAVAHEVVESGDENAIEAVLDDRFPQNHNHCYRYFGHPCAFAALCFDAQVEADPIGSGLYVRRTPHHATEDLHGQ